MIFDGSDSRFSAYDNKPPIHLLYASLYCIDMTLYECSLEIEVNIFLHYFHTPDFN